MRAVMVRVGPIIAPRHVSRRCRPSCESILVFGTLHLPLPEMQAQHGCR